MSSDIYTTFIETSQKHDVRFKIEKLYKGKNPTSRMYSVTLFLNETRLTAKFVGCDLMALTESATAYIVQRCAGLPY